MNDQIEKFRSYIDDELEIKDRLEFEKSLSRKELQELEDDILIKKLLSESSEELPIDYMSTLNQKLSQAHCEVFEKQHNLGSIFEKIKELAAELFSTFKRPRYAMGLASVIIVIAIAANMNNGLFEENSFYKRVSSELYVQENAEDDTEYARDASYDYGVENKMNVSEEPKEEVNASGEIAQVAPRSIEPLAKSNSAQELSSNAKSAQEIQHDKGKKIIYSASVEIETENYAEFEREFEGMLSGFGAFVDSRNIRSYKVEEDGVDKTYKHGEIVIRLKSEKFFEMLENVHSISDVVNETISSEDITLSYHDAAQKKKNLEAREAALLKLMEKAQTMEDIIAVDREIASVRSQIETYGDRLLVWDDQVQYSTIRFYVVEVQQKKPKIKAVPKNFGEKMADTFIVSINNIIYFAQNLVLLFVYNIINITIIVIVLILLVIFIKKRKKKKH